MECVRQMKVWRGYGVPMGELPLHGVLSGAMFESECSFLVANELHYDTDLRVFMHSE